MCYVVIFMPIGLSLPNHLLIFLFLLTCLGIDLKSICNKQEDLQKTRFCEGNEFRNTVI